MSWQEQLVKRCGVKPIQDGGLFTMWFASGPELTIHRCELLAQRHIILALESPVTPEDTRREVRPMDLVKARVKQSKAKQSKAKQSLICQGLKVYGSNGDGAARPLVETGRNIQNVC